MMSGRFLLILISYFCISVTAFAFQKTLPIQYENASTTTLKRIAKYGFSENSVCSFNFEAFLDNRQNKQTVAFSGKSIIASGVDAWLSDAQHAFFSNTTRDSATYQITAVPSLTRMYSYPESMNILAITAMKVDFLIDGERVDTRRYRGFFAKTNWANGDGEYLTALNEAVNDMLPKLVTDLNNVCKKVTATQAI
jgi:hypothetical protein